MLLSSCWILIHNGLRKTKKCFVSPTPSKKLRVTPKVVPLSNLPGSSAWSHFLFSPWFKTLLSPLRIWTPLILNLPTLCWPLSEVKYSLRTNTVARVTIDLAYCTIRRLLEGCGLLRRQATLSRAIKRRLSNEQNWWSNAAYIFKTATHTLANYIMQIIDWERNFWEIGRASCRERV